MFGFRFVKTEPTQFVLLMRNGRPRRKGEGLAFWYYAPRSSLVVVPTASANQPFMFPETTADFQDVSVQGQATFRIAEPEKTARLLDFTLGRKGEYLSEDPKKLAARVVDSVRVATRDEIQSMTLREAMSAGPALARRVAQNFRAQPTTAALGLELLDLSILAVKPKPETQRALEAQAREDLLRRADEAISARRNAAVEQERTIRENELSTEIAVELKKRQVRETQLDAERAAQERQIAIDRENLEGRISFEQRNSELVALATANARQEADAKAYGLAETMRALGADPKVVQALASVGMDSGKLMALAFRDLADNAARIGQLNVTPDLLREFLEPSRG